MSSSALEQFAQRKTRAALAASLPPYVTDRETPHERLTPISNAWTASLFDGPFYISLPRDTDRPTCSLVFVQSADGNTTADDPSSLGGGLTDQHLIYEGLSRVAAHAVLAGAGTSRTGNTFLSVWHPELVALRASLGLPRHPVQIVATRRGIGLEAGWIFNTRAIDLVLLAGPVALDAMRGALAVRPWIQVVPIEGADGLRDGFRILRQRGIERVSCIGGRTLASELVEANLVDDLYLTIAPEPGGEPNTPLDPRALAGSVVVAKHGTGPESGVRFIQRRLR
jgi:riboflavin biosynthesis pyrimidine reductase